MASPDASPRTPDPRHTRRVLMSSFLGSTIEFYDFLLYGLAASLVFGKIFFNDLSPALGTIASFATLAAGYLARPVGGVVFGYFGDRIGRKSMLVMTMSLMGGASVLIGLLPTYAQIGWIAPMLLVALRIVQGVAVGGEWGGAALMAFEHSQAERRGFSASFSNMGGPCGAVLGTLVMTAFSTLPDAQFLAWGWRIPFLLSAVLVGVGLFVRARVAESPQFAQVKASDAVAVNPLREVLRRYPRGIVLAAGSGIGAFALQSLLATFALTLAVKTGGHDRTTVLMLFAAASAVHVFTIPLFATLSDRVGRRPVMVGGAIAGAALAYPIFHLLASGSVLLVAVGFLIGNPLVQACMYGPFAAYVSEMFGTEGRYTGASIGYQLSSTLSAGLAPLAATSLFAAAGGQDPTTVALLVAGLCVVSGLAVLAARETSAGVAQDALPGGVAEEPVPAAAPAPSAT